MKMTCPDLMCVNERQKAVIDATTAALQVAADAALAELQPLFDAVVVALFETFDTMQPVITFTITFSNDTPSPEGLDHLALDIL